MFLICSKWGVERDDILVQEFLDLPIVLPSKESPIAKEITRLHDEIARATAEDDFAKIQVLGKHINELFYAIFELTPIEIELIEDTIRYTINLYQEKDNSIASAPADRSLFIGYAKRVQAVLSTMIGRKESIQATVYIGSKNVAIVSFSLKTGNSQDVEVISTPLGTDQLLLRLRKVMTEKISDKVYFVRRLKIYEERTIYFIKPTDARFWTRAVSYEDADNVIGDILETWRETNQLN